MKPIITWIVLANTQTARVLVNEGPGKGVYQLAGKHWDAGDPDTYRDSAGVGKSIAGHAVSAVQSTDFKREQASEFAKEIIADLAQDHADKSFDRLILASGPLMLGLMRPYIEDPLGAAVLCEIPKDFSTLPIEKIEELLGDHIAT